MLLDGNSIDMATVAVGGLALLISPLQRFRTKKSPLFIREKATTDMLNGVMLVPFIMMTLSVFYSDLLKELVTSAKVTVAIGGLAGLIFVIGELFKEK